MNTTLNNTMRHLAATAILGLAAAPNLFAVGYYHKPGSNVGYWDETDYWWTNDSYTSPLGTGEQANRGFLDPATLSVRTTDVVFNVFAVGSAANSATPATLRVEDGGSAAFNDIRIGTGYWGAFNGVIDVQSGGALRCKGGNPVLVGAGNGGQGVVTNAGTFRFYTARPAIAVGVNAGSTGSWVQNSGAGKPLDWEKYRDIVVGQDGEGELVALTDFAMSTNEGTVEGCILAGCGTNGTGRGTVEIAEGATVTAYEAYLGGYNPSSVGMLSDYFGGSASVAGSGNVVLKGGTLKLKSNRGRQYGADSLWIGAAPDAGGGVRADSHGEIRGWGKIDITDEIYQNKGVFARLGNGAIVADGEGVERTLDLSLVYQVTNVLSVADERSRTNGWYAESKGAVLFPTIDNAYRFNGSSAHTYYDSTTCLGCEATLAKPDLVGAVRLRVQRNYMQTSFCTAAMLLASDRADSHAAALPDKYLPIGFWKAGTFSSRTAQTVANRWDFTSAEIAFRYDGTKITKPDSRIAVLRWDDGEGKWVRVARYDAQPADCVVSSGTLTTTAAADDPWSLGLFCVAEEPILATTIISLR